MGTIRGEITGTRIAAQAQAGRERAQVLVIAVAGRERVERDHIQAKAVKERARVRVKAVAGMERARVRVAVVVEKVIQDHIQGKREMYDIGHEKGNPEERKRWGWCGTGISSSHTKYFWMQQAYVFYFKRAPVSDC